MNSKFFNNYIPASMWLSYHLIVPTWHLSFLSLLMLIRAMVILFCFIGRDMPLKRAPKYQIAIAWISTFIPTFMEWNSGPTIQGMVGELVAILGMVMFVFACLELGKSFGVSPALRKPISGGIYSYVSHPIYFSHVVFEFGILIASPTKWNLIIALMAWAFYALRASWEQKIVQAHINGAHIDKNLGLNVT